MIILPLRGPSCKLILAIFSDKLKLQNGPSVATRLIIVTGKHIKHIIEMKQCYNITNRVFKVLSKMKESSFKEYVNNYNI